MKGKFDVSRLGALGIFFFNCSKLSGCMRVKELSREEGQWDPKGDKFWSQ